MITKKIIFPFLFNYAWLMSLFSSEQKQSSKDAYYGNIGNGNNKSIDKAIIHLAPEDNCTIVVNAYIKDKDMDGKGTPIVKIKDSQIEINNKKIPAITDIVEEFKREKSRSAKSKDMNEGSEEGKPHVDILPIDEVDDNSPKNDTKTEVEKPSRAPIVVMLAIGGLGTATTATYFMWPSSKSKNKHKKNNTHKQIKHLKPR